MLAATDNHLSGNATIVLTNGRAFNFTVSGTYSARSDLSTLKLSGSGQSTGASLTLRIHGSDRALVSLRGRVLGQTLKYPN